MTKTVLISIVSLLVIALNVHADCRGCCSRHKGVTCEEGITLCKDGTDLSDKCQDKACNKCGGGAQYGTSEKTQSTGYNRKNWPHWIDEDGDCQNTRAEILIRDNIGTIKFKRNKGCNVSWGEWHCPYTGITYTKASDIDIDHIVPLSHAYKSGASNWTRNQKRQFANDPMNLLAVEDNANQSKSDKAPHEWKPSQKSYWKEYASRWKAIKTKYGLTISKQEARALKIMLR